MNELEKYLGEFSATPPRVHMEGLAKARARSTQRLEMALLSISSLLWTLLLVLSAVYLYPINYFLSIGIGVTLLSGLSGACLITVGISKQINQPQGGLS